LGTGTRILVALQLVDVAAVPLKVMVFAPCEDPKFVPVIVTELPIVPDAGFTLVIVGAGVITVNSAPLLATPPTVTTTLPDVALLGTGTRILVGFQPVAVAAVPLNVMVFVPCADPKLVPAIVTGVPAAPKVGLRLVMLGGGRTTVTVKRTPLLATPPTVTTTLPEVAFVGTWAVMLVALQFVVVAVVPPNVTVLVICAAPKFAPAIVTELPTCPEAGVRLVMVGVVLPPLPVLNDASTAPQLSVALRAALADVAPAAA
jgi:hypothetical protein